MAIHADTGEVLISVVLWITNVMDFARQRKVADRADLISEEDARNDPCSPSGWQLGTAIAASPWLLRMRRARHQV